MTRAPSATSSMNVAPLEPMTSSSGKAAIGTSQRPLNSSQADMMLSHRHS